MKNISIFCGAHEGKNPKYAEAAKVISEIIAKKGINIVFGGGNVGLMKIISDTALDNGVKVLGISLKSLHELELANPRLEEIIVAQTLFLNITFLIGYQLKINNYGGPCWLRSNYPCNVNAVLYY